MSNRDNSPEPRMWPVHKNGENPREPRMWPVPKKGEDRGLYGRIPTRPNPVIPPITDRPREFFRGKCRCCSGVEVEDNVGVLVCDMCLIDHAGASSSTRFYGDSCPFRHRH